ncbi:hypothetical protein TH8_17890 [Thalassospira profundimaris]|nr:hypothetical protein TH8_17890 [Thalassospira profundimaris]
MSDNSNTSPPENREIYAVPSNSLSGAFGDILKLVFGPSANEVGLILADNIRSWQYKRKNAESIAIKIKEELNRRKIDKNDIEIVPEGHAFNLLEASSMEGEETVQNLWAQLVANAMDPGKKVKISKAYIDILKSLSPAEASFLSIIKKINTPLDLKNDKEQDHFQRTHDAALKRVEKINQEAEAAWRIYPADERATAIQNLIRLRCITVRNRRQLRQHQLMRGAWGARDVQIDARKLAMALDHLERTLLLSLGSTEIPIEGTNKFQQTGLPEAKYDLTSLGLSLMQACEGSR